MTSTEPQTVVLGGRRYTFTPEGAEERQALTTVGSLTNSRGQWAGYVVRLNSTGSLSLLGGPKVSRREESEGLRLLKIGE